MRRHHHLLAILAAVHVIAAAIPWTSAAQDEPGFNRSENPNVFLERSYLSPFMPTGKNLILEGFAAGHYWIHNELTDRVWLREGGWKAFNWPISMIFVVRIYNDYSSPVRTPSFILRPIYFQAFHLNRTQNDDGTGGFRLLGMAAGITHHSNGQAGCTFQGESYDASIDDCSVTDPTLRATNRANTVDGSFSSNFIPVDVSVRWGTLDENAVVERQLTVRFKGEIHPLGFIKGGLTKALASQYGQYMTGLGVESEKRFDKGVARLEFYNQVRFGGVKHDADYAGQVEASWVWHRQENIGLFSRVHWGSDYYNVRFQDTGAFLQVGFMWDPGRLDQFVRQRSR
jgi:hypothetical protein